ncbi:MAG TPA: hypothetical protein VFH61_11185 [Thermoleophilia bacterium]|nr:hypothetical protein [Thermoleophilia bacterium]
MTDLGRMPLGELSKDTLISLLIVANRKAELWDRLIVLLSEAMPEREPT